MPPAATINWLVIRLGLGIISIIDSLYIDTVAAKIETDMLLNEFKPVRRV